MRALVAVLGVLMVTSALWAGVAYAADAPASDSFGKVQFDEVVQVLKAHHLRPGLDRPRVWAAAANGVLSVAAGKVELLDADWRLQVAAKRARFAGKTAPLRCGEKALPGVVLHSRPAAATWREQEKELAKGEGSGEALVDALVGWQTPFDRTGFDCVVAHAGTLVIKAGKTAKTQQRLWRGAATYLLRAIDPHSRLTTPRAWALVNEDVSRVVDLGLTFRWRKDRAVVHEVLAHASANARQVRVGDVLVQIDGKAVRGQAQAQIVGLLQRPVGSSIRLAFRRPGVEAPLEVTLKYVDTREKDVEVEPIVGLPGALRVRVRKFAAASGRQVRAELESPPYEEALSGVLLDLRGNRGGIIPEAVTLVELFRRGGLIGRVRTRDATVAIALSRKRRKVLQMPVVMLVDGACASACEFVAASLQDSGRALIVGRHTFGKATLQEYMSLKTSKSRIMITIAMFSTPNGLPIQAHGVPPDLEWSSTGKSPHKRRGEAALSFHLLPPETQRERRPRTDLGALRSCWTAATANMSEAGDTQLTKAVAALRCLMAM